MFRVYSSFGEIDSEVETPIVETILYAWNYEARVYDLDDNLIFYGWLDDEEQNELLEPYGIRVIDIGKYRYIQNIKNNVVYIADWQDEIDEGSDFEVIRI